MNCEHDMLKYINRARQFPSSFIPIIDQQLATFLNDREIPIAQDIIYQTNEGKQAWKQARQYLQKQTPLPAFTVHEGLSLSCRDHAIDLATNGTFGHRGSDQSTFSERILRYCKKGQGAMAEIIGADFLIKDRNNAQLTVLGLIIDDGVPDRGHRRTIFNPQYRYIGCKSQVQNDRLISVFNLTQNNLKLRELLSLSQLSKNSSSEKSGMTQTVSQKVQTQLSNTQSHLKDASEKTAPNNQICAFNQVSNLIAKKVEKKARRLQDYDIETRKLKKIKQKKQNTRSYYEEDRKITENIVQIYYSDGTMQEKIQKHTVYN